MLTCHLQEFSFVSEQKTWEQAQSHCRKNHGDLVTVYDAEGLDSLRDLVKNDAWIGLRSNSVDGFWKWSQPGVKDSNLKWAENEPHGGQDKCAFIRADRLYDHGCSHTLPFVCYNGEDTWLLVNEHVIMFTDISNG